MALRTLIGGDESKFGGNRYGLQVNLDIGFWKQVSVRSSCLEGRED